MKKVLLFCICSMMMVSAMAQDVIFMNGGKEMKARVINVTDTEVQFTSWTDIDGTVFVVPMRKVEKIKFENGFVMDYDAMRDKQKQDLRKAGYGDKAMVSSVQPPLSDTLDMSANARLANLESMTYNLYKERQLERKYSYLETARILKTAGLILGVLNGVVTFASAAIANPSASSVLIALARGALTGVATYWVPCGIIAMVSNSNARMIHTASVYEHDFEVGGMQMTSGVNLMHDDVMNNNSMGVGLTINF